MSIDIDIVRQLSNPSSCLGDEARSCYGPIIVRCMHRRPRLYIFVARIACCAQLAVGTDCPGLKSRGVQEHVRTPCNTTSVN